MNIQKFKVYLNENYEEIRKIADKHLHEFTSIICQTNGIAEFIDIDGWHMGTNYCIVRFYLDKAPSNYQYMLSCDDTTKSSLTEYDEEELTQVTVSLFADGAKQAFTRFDQATINGSFDVLF